MEKKYLYWLFLASIALLFTLLIGTAPWPWIIKFIACIVILIVILGLLIFGLQEKEKKAALKKRVDNIKTIWKEPSKQENIDLLFDNAIGYGDELIRYHKYNNNLFRGCYLFLQFSTVVLTLLTTVIASIDKSDVLKKSLGSWVQYFPWLVILFSGIAALLATVSTIFPLREG